MSESNTHQTPSGSRRDFIKTSAALAAGASALVNAQIARTAHAAGSDVLKIGLVGCGGRGRGAAVNALKADPHVRLVALADVFEDQIARSVDLFKNTGQIADRMVVPKENQFVGFDAYQHVIDSGVDVVLLATPPHFRPLHLQACIDADKHVFAEKPTAIDAPGVRRVLAAAEEARQKGLAIVTGLCWRYNTLAREAMAKVHDGAIGRIVAVHSAYNTSMPGKEWPMRREAGWTDLQWQLRNWYWFTWLSGDHIVEQALHSIDKASWALHEETPAVAASLAGLQSRRGPEQGQIFDHHAVLYEHASGLKHFHYCRQQSGCARGVQTNVIGTQGVCHVEKATIRDHDNKATWRYRGPRGVQMHQAEMDAMFASIRSGEPINDGEFMAKSTMTAILGRMASYTGKKIGWEQAIASKEDFTLPSYDWDVSIESPPIAVPGVTPFR